MTDRIEKTITLNAPIERVWRALTDHREFGTWFRVKLDGPFAIGTVSTGHITYPGYEHVKWKARVVEMKEPTLFAFTWHPYAVAPDTDYDQEEPTRVEFRLAPAGTGTHLVVIESGFDKIPANRRPEALRMNDGGWAEQMRNIAVHVGG